jgi:hypothetical protein
MGQAVQRRNSNITKTARMGRTNQSRRSGVRSRESSVVCRLEKEIARRLDARDIEYERPEQLARHPTNLDFYIPEFDLYVEVKQFHTDRIASQISTVPKDSSVMVLVGPNSVDAFFRFVDQFNAPVAQQVEATDLKSVEC